MDDDGGATTRSRLAGKNWTRQKPKAPSATASATASHTRRAASSRSPRPIASATRGVVTDGRNAIDQKSVEKTWLAAPMPARTCASPMRPTQYRSTAPASGKIARLSIAGSASPMILRSSWSPHGHSRHGRCGWPAGANLASACASVSSGRAASGRAAGHARSGWRPALPCACAASTSTRTVMPIKDEILISMPRKMSCPASTGTLGSTRRCGCSTP